MRVLAINCGSASLKFAVWEIGVSSGEQSAYQGSVEWRSSGLSVLHIGNSAGTAYEQSGQLADHQSAIDHVLDWLESVGELKEIQAVGHRVVHGGSAFAQAVRINADVMCQLAAASELAPLHNPPALSAIERTRERLSERFPMVAVFDTAFHRQMPPRAELYPLKRSLATRLGLRRYGFHGIAHRYMAERCAQLMGRPLEKLRLISLQLGNGCSAAAIEHGRSIDTSMGFTPLEGLMMGTRCGDLDPGLVIYLARHAVQNLHELEKLFNDQSGLFGVSGHSRDMRDLLQDEASGDADASLAVDMFCYRVRKYVGAYLAVLRGADAVLFGGGIGENSSQIRHRICEALEWAGLTLDPKRNGEAVGIEGRISSDRSPVAAYTISVREELLVAREVVECLQRQT